MAGLIAPLRYALDKLEAALGKPPDICIGCAAWFGGRSQCGGEWRNCVKEDEADAAIASGEVRRA